MKKRNTKVLADRWFDKADNLWLYANAAYKETKLTAPFCFDCQQIAELYLKGFLVRNNVKPPRVHHLPKLLELCIKIDINLSRLLAECKTLTKYYIFTRYPTFPFPEYSTEEAESAKRSVERIIAFIIKGQK